MADLAVLADYVVPVRPRGRIIRDGAVVVDDRRIIFVGKREEALSLHSPDRVIGGEGRIAFPGLVNAHDHMFQTLLRNLAVDMHLLDWLRTSIWPALSVFTAEDVRRAARLGILENLRSGVTTVVDNHYGGRYYDEVIEEMLASGIRGVMPRGGYEINAHEPLLEDADRIISDAERLIRRYHGADDGRIMVGIAPMHPCFASEEFLLRAKELSDRYGVVYHTHTGESVGDQELQLRVHGKTDVTYLHEIGVLGPRYMAVHAVQVSDEEVKLLARDGAHVIHNPVSNMYLGNGAAKVPEMLREGVNVALGTDGPASNNNEDLITSMKVAALLHKSEKRDPTAVTAWDVLEMATVNGARSIGRGDDLGSLEVGKRADIMLLDYKRAHMAPMHDPVGALVYCATVGDVDSVVVDGRVLMEGGRVLTMDEDRVIEEAEEAAASVRERVKEEYGVSFPFEEGLV